MRALCQMGLETLRQAPHPMTSTPALQSHHVQRLPCTHFSTAGLPPADDPAPPAGAAAAYRRPARGHARRGTAAALYGDHLLPCSAACRRCPPAMRPSWCVRWWNCSPGWCGPACTPARRTPRSRNARCTAPAATSRLICTMRSSRWTMCAPPSATEPAGPCMALDDTFDGWIRHFQRGCPSNRPPALMLKALEAIEKGASWVVQ